MLRAMRPHLLAISLVLAAACGKGDKSKAGPGSGSGSAAVAAIPPPPLGVDAVKRFNYPYGDGEAGYKKAQAAYKTKDWAAVAEACGGAIQADAYHLDAHRLLAVALAQLGKPADAVDHLVTILAQDYYRFHAELAADADLAAFWATPEGAAVKAVDAQLGAAAATLATTGVQVLARRSTFKWPSKTGAQWATTRGELYAIDLETRRFVRLTHTGHTLAAVLPSPSGKELAVVGYEKVEMPDPAAGATAPPVLARAWVEAYDPATWQPTTKRATVAKGRAAAVTYGAGDQLLVGSIAAKGRWELGAATWSSVDRATGKTTKTSAPPDDAPLATVTLDEAWVDAPLVGVKATWAPATATTPALTSQLELASGKVVDIPESTKAERDSITVAPGGARIAFATWTDPCAADAHRSLYVADAATGQLTHLLTEASRFRSRWLDDARLAYEDAQGHIRIWSATDHRELLKIDDRSGLALAGLNARLPPLCKTAPPVVEPDTGGEETEPGDGSGGEPGPATTPD